MLVKKQILVLSIISILIAILSNVVGFYVNCNTKNENIKSSLTSTLTNGVGIIYSAYSHSNDKKQVLDLIKESNNKVKEFNRDQKLIIAENKNDSIHFLFVQDDCTMENKTISNKTDLTIPISKTILSGRGTLIGKDYNGNNVIVSYVKINELGWTVLLKYKKDNEFYKPILRIFFYMVLISILIVIVGLFFFTKAINPMIKRVEDSERTLNHFLNNTADAIIISTDNKIRYVNKSIEKLLGYTQDEVKNTSAFDYIYDANEVEFIKNIFYSRIHEKSFGNSEIYEFRLRHKNGNPVYVGMLTTIYEEPEGVSTYLSLRDVSLQEKFEKEKFELIEKIKESETKLNRILNNAADAIMISTNNKVTFINEAAKKMFGYSFDEIKGHSVFEYIYNEEERELIRKVFYSNIENKLFGIPAMFVTSIRHKNGSKVYCEQLTTSYLEPEGIVSYISLRDASIKEKFEKEKFELIETIKEKEETQNRILNNTADSILVSINNEIDYVNLSAEKMLGYPLVEIKGKSIFDFFYYEKEAEAIKNIYSKKIKGNSLSVASIYEITLKHKNGKPVSVETIASTYIESPRRVLSYLSCRDISAKKIFEKEKSELVEKVKESEKSLSEAQKIFKIGIYKSDIENNKNFISKEFCEIFEIEPNISNFEFNKNIFSLINRDYLKKQKKSIRNFISGNTDYFETEFRLVFKDNRFKWVHLRGISHEIKNGKANKISLIVQDITERKIAEKQLKESEQKYQNIFESTNDMILIHDFNGNILEFNKQAHEIHGYTNEEFKNLNLDDINTEESRKLVKSRVEKLKKEGSDIFEVTHLTKDGRYINVEVSAKTINYKGKPAINSIERDVTDRKHTHELILKLSAAVEQSSAIIAITDIEGNLEYVNKKFCEVTGYSFEEAIGKNPRILKSGDKSVEFYKDLWDTVKSGKTWEGEFLNKKKDGTLYYENASISPLKDDDGKIIRFVAIKEDVTEKKKIETENKINEGRFATLLEISNIVDYSINEILDNALEKIVNITNSEIGYIYKYSTESKELSLYNWSMFVINNCKSINPQTIYHIDKTGLWGNAIRQSKPIIVNNNTDNSINNGYPEDYSVLRNFMTIPVVYGNNIVAVAGVANKPEGYTSSDVYIFTLLMQIVWRKVVQKNFEDEIIAEKEKAEQSDHLKSAFLANMSHEIRTPLNAIMGFSELLLNPNLVEDKRGKYANIIKDRGNDLLNLINDILDISKIESGLLDVKESHMDINQIMIEIIQSFRLNNKIDKQQIIMSWDNDLSNTQSIIKTDPARIKQIVNNLVVNALKFTQHGEIKLGCRLQNSDTLLFFVKDTGIGIPKDKIDLIFTRFRQVKESLLIRESGGVGLGLSICKGILELMNGKIWVESDEGKGSTFHFTIPYKPILGSTVRTDSINESQKTNNWENKTLLIVEDHQSNIEYLVELLSDTKIKYEVAYNGYSAIFTAQQNEEIDLILMDIGLPDIDGLEVTKRIREFNSEVVIIAQTAFATNDSKDRCIEAGCDDYISKPISQNKLFEIMKKYL